MVRYDPTYPPQSLCEEEMETFSPYNFQLKFHFVVFYFLKVENQSQLHSLASTCFSFPREVGTILACSFEVAA